MSNKYTSIIGLEVHIELKTKSKMFCGCSADYFGKEPNVHTCPVCLGLPGALPVPNKKAIEWCVRVALALNCKINKFSKFDRKNYFYPDLPKGYQISQFDLPFGHDGWIELSDKKKIHIKRVHMEEDTGKLLHQGKNSLIDFNRGGVPLVEIVTEPDFHNAVDVTEYLRKLHQIVRYLDISNADMEKGQMRLEPNISLTEDPEKLPSYKVEVKNINSFKFVEKAINYEVARQEELLEKGEIPKQETRGYDNKKQVTFSQRSKEDAQNYRYFPEPDIPPIRFTDFQIQNFILQNSELPDEKFGRFKQKYGLSAYDAEILTRTKPLADYFEDVVSLSHLGRIAIDEGVENAHTISPKAIANWIINKKIDTQKVSAGELIDQIYAAGEKTQVDEEKLDEIIRKVLDENAKAIADYKKGKENALMFLLGQVMRKIGEKIDTQSVKERLLSELK